MAPAAREPELERGNWLVLAFAVVSVPDVACIPRAVQAVQTFEGKVQLGIRPFNDYDESRTWYQAYGNPESPLWLVVRNGVVVHEEKGPRSVEQVVNFVKTSFSSPSPGTRVCPSRNIRLSGNMPALSISVSKLAGKKNMSLPEALRRVREHPGMYFRAEFHVATAFIGGFDLASEGGLLVGFREWLIIRLGYGNNLDWAALVVRLTFPEAQSPSDHLRAEDNQKLAIESLFHLLEAFLKERESPDGLRRIFVRYEEWLKRQDWYGPSSPHWISDDQA